ncbi:MAG: ArsC/Spx/MgsR family protein [Polyangiaceae bacterium]
MLDAKKIKYEYREYTEQPLSKSEIKAVLAKLGLSAAEVLRKNDAAYKALGLTGKESEAALIAAMAEHPTLLQRPIGVKGKKAVLGRPPENLLTL